VSVTGLPFGIVLVDKPVTATAKEAKELGELAKAKGLVLYPFQNRRWDSDFLALRRLIALPESSPQSLGTIVEFESQLVPCFSVALLKAT
jgi:predicted dehydrogenase